jgi:hypothetical protein
MATYNGFKNWNQWNVSLWINNDDGLYRLARECVKNTKSKAQAARVLLDFLNDTGVYTTPDKARYSIAAIRAAIADI